MNASKFHMFCSSIFWKQIDMQEDASITRSDDRLEEQIIENFISEN